MRYPRLIGTMLLATMVITPIAQGQRGPTNGMRETEVRAHAIVNATIIVRPGQRLEGANLVIRDGIIESVGVDVNIPSDAQVWDATGLTVYPGFIDAALLIDPGERESSPGAHWNDLVHPEINMIDQPLPDASLREQMRKMGFTSAAVYPEQGIFRGTGVFIALADEDEHALAYLDRTSMAVAFQRKRRFGRNAYPNSMMGAIALMRQTLYDAQWHEASRRVYEQFPQGNEPTIRADALDALQMTINRYQPVLFDVSDELDAIRASQVVNEFDLDVTYLGSGFEFRRLNEIVALNRSFIVPLNFPKAPEVKDVAAAEQVSLRELTTWEQAPTNPRRLIRAGVQVALTTNDLENRKDFLGNLRKAIKHDLTEDEALASLTTTPAAMLGIENVLGTLEADKVANFVVVEGSIFEKDSKIRETWINGRRHEISKAAQFQIEGDFDFWTNRGHFQQATIDTEKKSIAFDVGEEKKLKAKKVSVEKDRITFLLDGSALDTEGIVRFSGLIAGNAIAGTGIMPDGDRFQFTFEPDEEDEDAEDEVAMASEDENDDDQPEANEETDEIKGGPPPETLTYPIGAYGLEAPPQSQNVYVHNATIWTQGEAGIIENGCLVIENGKITHVGAEPSGGAPQGYLVLDAEGKHITPGLLDCHSHTGISGGVNEGSHSVTSEVRIADVVNPDDVNWYRQLAGGVNCVNQLHGSANAIGGQNSVVKIKWGGTVEDMRVPDAIAGIKFALGENPKRSEGRYPDTRMGVETVIRDAFTAASDYKAHWDRYLALTTDVRERIMPPRRDLQLEALVEIIKGERIIHCHSYRQDEILMLIRVADDFGFTIGTFQHVLEGYKVADAIAQHGAGASTFSDWWAYKVEVMDAVPYNGALMDEVGVVVSFNSDSSELARRMNTEAAKAVRYGGLDPQEALKFVTINPAKQLRIDHRIGSLEPGKDGDFVIWSHNPLSTYARCEQNWIEGARYFDLRIDEMLRKKARDERQRIMQKILVQSESLKKSEKEGGDGPPGRGARGQRPSVLIQGDCEEFVGMETIEGAQ
ncbi:MAG: amidohydrolase family protein [Planctomycetota bacterium]|nr:amidohydrolase family protein [Planctomycetota bacterium]